METMVPARPMTFRVENIPPGTTADDLKKFFYTEDQPHLVVKSIVPAVDSNNLDDEYTATVTFRAPNKTVESPRTVDEYISVDDDFYGFTPLNHAQEPIAADIIAATGLAAHPFGSWAHSPQHMWLRDYLPRDISNARVLIYGYPSRLYENISRGILSDHSNNFIQRLLTMRDSAKCAETPIVFIGHSLDCLIIKKALSDINGTIGIYNSKLPVKSVVFLGAPHRGLHTAALETLVMSRPSEDMIRELKSESPTLTELNDKFRHVAKDIDILTCYELNPTKTAIEMPDGTWKREGPHKMMVSLDSARQYHPHENLVACHADHSQIAKLKRGENSIYPSIRWAIKHALLSAAEEQATVELSRLQVPFNSSEQIRNALRGLYQHAQNLRCEGKLDESEAAYLRYKKALEDHHSRQEESVTTELKSTAQSGDATDEEMRILSLLKKRRPHYHNLVTDNKAVNGVVSQWQTGVDSQVKIDHTRSLSSPSLVANGEAAPSIFDQQVVHSNRGLDESSNTSVGVEIGKSSPPVVAFDYPREVRLRQASADASLSKYPDPSGPQGPRPNDESFVASMVHPPVTSESEHHVQASPSIPSEQLSRTGPQAKAPFVPSQISTTLEPGAVKRPPPYEDPAPGNTALSIKKTVLDNEMASTIKTGNQEAVRCLVGKGYDINCRDGEEYTPLLLAALFRQEKVIKVALELGADQSAVNTYGSTTLHVVAISRDGQYPCTQPVMECLLQNGLPLESISNDGNTPLLTSARNGALQAAASLLDHGASISATAKDGSTPLHEAINFSQDDMVDLLIAHGAPLEARDTSIMRQTPVHRAAISGKWSGKIIRSLLEAGADCEATTFEDGDLYQSHKPLALAIRNEARPSVEELLKSGAQVDVQSPYESPPLFEAAKFCLQTAGITRSLLEAGADIEATQSSDTPLVYAIKRGNEVCVRELLEFGANVEFDYFRGYRPLHCAARAGHLSIIELLLHHGANPCARARWDNLMKTPSRVSVLRGVPVERKQQIRARLKEAQKSWKQTH